MRTAPQPSCFRSTQILVFAVTCGALFFPDSRPLLSVTSPRKRALSQASCQETLRIVVLEDDAAVFGEVQGYILAAARELGFRAQSLTRSEAFSRKVASSLGPCLTESVLCVSCTPCRSEISSDIPVRPLWANLEVLDLSADESKRAWKRPCVRPGFAEMMWSSGPVWDYLHSNIAFLSRQNLAPHAKYLPLRFFPGIVSTDIFIPSTEGTDVLFIGSLVFSPRRQRIIDDLRGHGVSVVVLSEVYGVEREEHIRTAKIVINVHYYVKNFETIRLFWLLSLGAFIVAEADEEQNREVMSEYNGTMVFAKYDDLVDTVIRYLPMRAERERIARTGHAFIRSQTPGQALRPLFQDAMPACDVV